MATNGREQISGTIAGQAFQVSSANLLPILILLVGGVAGYLVYLSQDARLAQLYARQEKMLAVLEAQNTAAAIQTLDLFKAISTLQWNLDKPPAERLPLFVAPPSVPHPPTP